MKRALVIEDNDDNMELITFILEENGYTTIRANTGKQGVHKALSEHPDFVILDIQLPDMGGIEVLASIRRLLGTKTPIIAMTSYAMSGDRERLLAAGCTGYIEKPIDPMQVLGQISQIVGDEQ